MGSGFVLVSKPKPLLPIMPAVLAVPFETFARLMKLQLVDDALMRYGYPAGLPIGAPEAILIGLRLLPRRYLFGAGILTAALAGAVALHLP